MIKHKIILTGLALSLAGTVLAQNEVDVLRYSFSDFGGSARVQALGGAQAALGADISNTIVNPAGLGLFRRSEFTITPSIGFNSAESMLRNGGNTNSPYTDTRNNFNVANIGVVFTELKDDDPYNDWKSGAFGITFSRINSFQSNYTYQGTIAADDNVSLLNSLAQSGTRKLQSNPGFDGELSGGGQDLISLEALGYWTYLLDTSSVYNDFIPVARRGNIVQSERIESRGAQNQWDFAYGANFRDKLYIGGGLGLVTFTYRQQRTYTETEESMDTYFRKFTLQDNLNTSGAGFNLKGGLIYRPSDVVRFGASLQSPTFYSLNDEFDTSLSGEFDPGYLPGGATSISNDLLPGEFDYNLTTPFRATAGVAVFASKYGFLTADAEFVNYSQGRLNSDFDETLRDVNNDVKNAYGKAMNYRIGIEGRMDIFRGRIGFAHYGDPFNNQAFERSKKFYTAGVGIKKEKISFDVALVNSRYKTLYSPYALENAPNPLVETAFNNTNLLFTFGFTF